MHITPPVQSRPDLTVVKALAGLLERVEHQPRAITPEQYRSIVQRLSSALAQVSSDAALQAVLAACPATAELYENLQYAHAGLCRSPLDAALGAELQARQAIARAMRPAGGVAPA